jgi:HPt (histidine-containing phosphotransfer) domain-containing protein
MSEDNTIIVKIDQDIEDLIPQFMENTRKDISIICDALLKNDLETIRRIGHSMKSYGIGYGFDYISTLGKSIEAAAAEDVVSVINQAIAELTNYLDKVMIVYA